MTNAKRKHIDTLRDRRARQREEQELLAEAKETGNYGILDDDQLASLAAERGVLTEDHQDRDDTVNALQAWDDEQLESEGDDDDENGDYEYAARIPTEVAAAAQAPAFDGKPAGSYGDDYADLDDEELDELVGDHNEAAHHDDIIDSTKPRDEVIAALREYDRRPRHHAGGSPVAPQKATNEIDISAAVDNGVVEGAVPDADPDAAQDIADDAESGSEGDLSDGPNGYAADETAGDGTESTGDQGGEDDDEDERELPDESWTHDRIDAWVAEHLDGFEMPKDATVKSDKLDAIRGEIERRDQQKD